MKGPASPLRSREKLMNPAIIHNAEKPPLAV